MVGGQPSSSEPSAQALWLSHRSVAKTFSPFLQVKVGRPSSSEPSWQSKKPSQRELFWMVAPFLYLNPVLTQPASSEPSLQSEWPSQRESAPMMSPFLHVKLEHPRTQSSSDASTSPLQKYPARSLQLTFVKQPLSQRLTSSVDPEHAKMAPLGIRWQLCSLSLSLAQSEPLPPSSLPLPLPQPASRAKDAIETKPSVSQYRDSTRASVSGAARGVKDGRPWPSRGRYLALGLAALVATLLSQARAFKRCISANSCQNSRDYLPDTKALRGQAQVAQVAQL